VRLGAKNKVKSLKIEQVIPACQGKDCTVPFNCLSHINKEENLFKNEGICIYSLPCHLITLLFAFSHVHPSFGENTMLVV
jgi:hypothetical protein